MKFSTPVKIVAPDFRIEYRHKMLSLGSCFSENIGKKLQRAAFQIDINPFGVLFNPATIAQNLELLIENRAFSENHLSKNNSLYFNFAFDTSFAAVGEGQCLKNINARFLPAAESIKEIDFLLLTFGTAWIFELKTTGEIVANCHKLPAENFIRRRLTVEEIVFMFEKLLLKLKTINPRLRIILTVSPVRHAKDGLHENSLSKSVLLLAAEKLEKTFDNITYFPAYEIVTDELRDYRFYAADMLHPSETAIEYVWECFLNTFCSAETQKTVSLAQQVAADDEHRPLHLETKEYADFLQIKEKRKKELLLKLKNF